VSDAWAERIWEQLKRIADTLERLAPPETAPDSDPEPETCPHPPELRISFGMTNGQPDWQCQACGYRTVTS
jgi:hypothetical protein